VDAASIESALKGRFGRPLAYFDSIDSTQTEAFRWSEEGAPDGALVVTDHQLAGRGRRGRSWFSQPGRLLQFSVLLRPQLAVERLGLITTALGLGVAEGIEQATGLAATTKWPNDVMIDERKLAGILVETHVGGSAIGVAVAGVGINVSWRADEVPAEIAGRATSLLVASEKSGLGPLPRRTEILAVVLVSIEEAYRLATSDPGELLRRARSRSSVLGRRVTVRFGDGAMLEGIARTLAANGALVVETDEGVRELDAGEIEQVRSS
jgi:BirA family biotin operon repressor/biotin-[acetyl-CoA-carboxylase] ligase